MKNKNLINTNVAIIYNETMTLVQQICTNRTVSGHPIIIAGYDTFTIVGIPPNPVAGIINVRFGHFTSISQNINSIQSKVNKIFKNKEKVKGIGDGSGKKSQNSTVKKIINEINNAKNNDPSTTKNIYVKSIIENTCNDVILKRLVTPIRLPNSILQVYAKQILMKTQSPDESYGYDQLNELIIFTILKTINF